MCAVSPWWHLTSWRRRILNRRVTSRARRFIVALALALLAPTVSGAQTNTCREEVWPYSALELLALGVTYGMPLSEETSRTTTAPTRPLLDEMGMRLRALRSAPAQRGHVRVLEARIGALIVRHLPPMEQLARSVAAHHEVAATVEALVLWAQAHEHIAERIAGLELLAVPTPADRARFRLAEPTIARLADLAARLDAIGQRPLSVICVFGPRSVPVESCAERRATWRYGESDAHRRVAIVLYATAVHLARAAHAMSALTWAANERLHDDANRLSLQDALGHQSLFTPREDEFDAGTPGAVLLETTLVSGGRLASFDAQHRSP